MKFMNNYKIFKKKIIFFCIFLVTSCQSIPKHVELADQAILSFSREIRDMDGLQLIGSGGAYHDDIKGFSICFLCEERLALNQVRKLVVKTAEHFINKINADTEIRPYLHKYPITIENIHLNISFYFNKSRVSSDFIGFASIPNLDPDHPTHNIHYAIYDQDTESLVTIFSETYEDALQIVNQINQDDLLAREWTYISDA